MSATTCRDCGSPIVFVRLPTGKALPVDPVPDADGNVAAVRAGGRLVGYVLSQARPDVAQGHRRYMPHAASCSKRERRKTPREQPTLFAPTVNEPPMHTREGLARED